MTQLSDYNKLQQARKELPIYKARDILIQQLKQHNTLIIVGETGSGKTTQLPQYILEAGINKKGRIGITQPRRVAAITIAQRVAKETGSQLGHLVGYSIRFEDVTSKHTKIKYMTDGMLLRESQLDPDLKRYSVIILDEAHERTLNTDILFGVVKAAQQKRPDLKIVVMSATLEAEAFSKYYNNAKILYVKGRQHPVEMFYCSEEEPDFQDACVTATLQLHLSEKPGDILVFLTGQEEIENVGAILEDKVRLFPPEIPKLIVCPIFSSLPSEKQMQVFEPTPEGCRKVVLATNIAETSITINGIKYVIDTGLVKVRAYNPKTGMESLKIMRISKASAAQRKGRAGRECPGKCFRLYTEEEYSKMDMFTVPEIKRCNLSEIVLQLKSLGINNVLTFDFLDKPNRNALIKSLEQLYAIGALNKNGTLSEFGKKLAQLPLEPMFSATLLKAEEYECVSEILTIIAMLSVEAIFYSPSNQREKADKAKGKFASIYGDHITLLKVYREYKAARGDPQWCWGNYINSKSMKKVLEVRKQLADILQKMGIRMSSAPERDTTPIRKCLAAGFFLNAAVRVPKKRLYRTLISNQEVKIHPSSVLKDPLPDYVIFNTMVCM